MDKAKMTIRQLDMAARETIYLQARSCYSKAGQAMKTVELTDYMRAFDGVMSLEVFELTHFSKGYIAEVDMPPELIEALAANAERPE